MFGVCVFGLWLQLYRNRLAFPLPLFLPQGAASSSETLVLTLLGLCHLSHRYCLLSAVIWVRQDRWEGRCVLSRAGGPPPPPGMEIPLEEGTSSQAAALGTHWPCQNHPVRRPAGAARPGVGANAGPSQASWRSAQLRAVGNKCGVSAMCAHSALEGGPQSTPFPDGGAKPPDQDVARPGRSQGVKLAGRASRSRPAPQPEPPPPIKVLGCEVLAGRDGPGVPAPTSGETPRARKQESSEGQALPGAGEAAPQGHRGVLAQGPEDMAGAPGTEAGAHGRQDPSPTPRAQGGSPVHPDLSSLLGVQPPRPPPLSASSLVHSPLVPRSLLALPLQAASSTGGV